MTANDFREDMRMALEHMEQVIALQRKAIKLWDDGGSAVLFHEIIKEQDDLRKRYDEMREEHYNKTNPRNRSIPNIMEMLRPGTDVPQ